MARPGLNQVALAPRPNYALFAVVLACVIRVSPSCFLFLAAFCPGVTVHTLPALWRCCFPLALPGTEFQYGATSLVTFSAFVLAGNTLRPANVFAAVLPDL
eukprot:2920893-Rhodomonas_salina.1